MAEQNRYLQARLKFSQLNPTANMQLPSCENDLNKTGRVDPAVERPGQTEDLFAGQSQIELTYLFDHFSFVFPLRFSPSHRAGDGQIQTSLR